MKDEKNKLVPLVSIIMPAYNTAAYIARGMESCRAQSYPYWELLVIDDASTDSTAEVVRQMAERERRIRLITAEHGGVSKARNLGMDSANGEYLLFLDSDDWLEENALEELLKLQAEYGGKLVACDRYSVRCSLEGTILGKEKRPKTSAVLSQRDALLMTGKEQYNNSSVNKLFDRGIVEQYGLRFDSSISYGEDELLVFQYLVHSDGMIFTKQAYWNVMERPGSATRAGFKSAFLTSLDEVDRMKEYALQEGISDEAILNRLMELKAEKARNLLRRYLDADARDPESLQRLRGVLREEKAVYGRHCTMAELVKTYAAAYCPWKLYRMIYGRKG